MSWSMFLLVIMTCLIQDIQSAPKAMSGCLTCRFDPCQQCRILAATVLWVDGDPEYGGARMVEMSCRNDRSMEQFCSQIQGKEEEFVDTVLDYQKNGTVLEVCARADFSVCDLSDIGKDPRSWTPKPLNICEQCQSIVDMIMETANIALTNIALINNTLPNELPFERLEFCMMAADSLKKMCDEDEQLRQFLSGLCTSIDGKEFEFVKAVMDCSGVKFKDDKVQTNCTIPGLNVEIDAGNKYPERKVCESFVESCKVEEFPFQSEV
ncbi:hypothetical protein DdX_16810 [Ditylenchus destructor]|uniref:Saposin B-type domain-containing protein n=1 Tax=Ditylenchus destructor TaxID=166010 RepID=A0AAD4MNY6_9BILA|nr:hypothetical protein DdX_16810 [Ditylenchus destructor]